MSIVRGRKKAADIDRMVCLRALRMVSQVWD
jgi:hypothetical protein